METARYIIGLDGGGTKTAGVLCAPDGAILAEAQGGPSNFQVIGVETAAKTILDVIQSCCHTIGCSTAEIGATVAGLTGAGRPNDQQRMADAVLDEARNRSLILANVWVESDARIALEGAFSGKSGIIVIAGTGSIVFGKDRKGVVHRGGGWGRLIGDEGSGYAIGREAFRAVARMIDGRGERTKLLALFGKKLELGTQEAIIEALYRKNFDVASAAPLVLEAAEKEDRVAQRILTEAREELREVISSVFDRLRGSRKREERIPLAFVGSLLTNQNSYSRGMRTAIRRTMPRISVQEAEASPVVGAALMAASRLSR